jgi:hypothetical protein
MAGSSALIVCASDATEASASTITPAQTRTCFSFFIVTNFLRTRLYAD